MAYKEAAGGSNTGRHKKTYVKKRFLFATVCLSSYIAMYLA